MVAVLGFQLNPMSLVSVITTMELEALSTIHVNLENFCLAKEKGNV